MSQEIGDTQDDGHEEAQASADWRGRPGAGAEVKQTLQPPAPIEPRAAPEAAPEAEAAVAPAALPATRVMPNSGYAVFFFPQAIEALGAVVTPYLVLDNGEPHLLCREVDTAGAFIELTLAVEGEDGVPQQVDLMVPANMVRLIASVRTDGVFGFARRTGGNLAY
ncbi:hypothetical protein [Luteimonas sp. e5]